MNKKKLSLIIAFCLAASMLAGCGKKVEDGKTQDITENDFTSQEDVVEGTQVTDITGADGETTETQVITDAEGNAVTDDNGQIITITEAQNGENTSVTTGETLSPEEIESIVMAGLETTTTAETTTFLAEASADNTYKFAYETLSDREKKLYDDIVDSAMTLSGRVKDVDDISVKEWAKVFGIVYNQEPQLFWLNKKVRTGRVYCNEIDTDKIKQMQKKIDAEADKLIAQADKKSSVFDKLKVFHDYLVLNSTFKQNEDIYGWNASIYNAFVRTDGQSDIQCAGYAKAMLYLCNKADIPCMVVSGTNKAGNSHAWNKVKVEGEWYNLDCTWDDPVLAKAETDYIRYNYFLVPDKWINNITHFNINTRTVDTDTFKYYDPPAATATAQNYFIKNGYVYNDKESAEKALKAQIDTAVANGTTVTQVMVGSKSVYDAVIMDAKSIQDYAKSKNTKVKGIADGDSSETMLLIEFDVKYNK